MTRVLVVDDDPRVRQAIALTIALEPDLVIVAEAADATTALALADGADPSVALVDLLVPEDVTGLALVRSLSERPHCAVVAMSIRGASVTPPWLTERLHSSRRVATSTQSWTSFGPLHHVRTPEPLQRRPQPLTTAIIAEG